MAPAELPGSVHERPAVDDEEEPPPGVGTGRPFDGDNAEICRERDSAENGEPHRVVPEHLGGDEQEHPEEQRALGPAVGHDRDRHQRDAPDVAQHPRRRGAGQREDPGIPEDEARDDDHGRSEPLEVAEGHEHDGVDDDHGRHRRESPPEHTPPGLLEQVEAVPSPPRDAMCGHGFPILGEGRALVNSLRGRHRQDGRALPVRRRRSRWRPRPPSAPRRPRARHPGW